MQVINKSRLEDSLNVLMITPFFRPNIGGVETHLDDLIEYLIEKGHKIFVITYQPLTTRVRAPKIERRRNLEVRRISWFGYNWFYKLEPYPFFALLYLFPALYLYSLIFVLMRGAHLDVIHVHGVVASLIGKLLRPVFKKRFVSTIHTTYHLQRKPILGRIFAWVLKSYDKVLFVSKGIKAEFTLYGIKEEKTDVFTYWADERRFRPLEKRECREILGWDGDFFVLFIGRLIKEKGPDVLVETTRLVSEDIHFAFITSGSYDEFLKMVGGKLPSNVTYVGPVNYKKLHLCYNAADLLVLPSQYREGFARVVLESALCGTPVVASDVGRLREVVSKEIGELVNPPTPEKFAKVIEYFYGHRAKLQSLSKRCADYAHRIFTSENAKTIEESYYSEGS